MSCVTRRSVSPPSSSRLTHHTNQHPTAPRLRARPREASLDGQRRDPRRAPDGRDVIDPPASRPPRAAARATAGAAVISKRNKIPSARTHRDRPRRALALARSRDVFHGTHLLVAARARANDALGAGAASRTARRRGRDRARDLLSDRDGHRVREGRRRRSDALCGRVADARALRGARMRVDDVTDFL